MDSELERVSDKIRKLLALSTSSNPNEAALAAARAAALMQQHQISEAALATSSCDAEVGTHDFGDDARRYSPWRGILAGGIALVCGCSAYRTGANLRLIGRRRDVQAAAYLFDLIRLQVERLAEASWSQSNAPSVASPRAWKNAFRLGCVETINARLREQHHRSKEELARQAAAGESVHGGGSAKQALVVLDARAQDVARLAAELRLRRGPQPRLTSARGLHEGRRAGHAVDLGGGARAAIAAPRARLGTKARRQS